MKSNSSQRMLTKSAAKAAKQAVKKSKRRIALVTGPSSGIGIELIKALLARGDEVRVLFRENPSSSERWKRVPSGVIPYIADLTLKIPDQHQTLLDACTGVENIYHLAGLTKTDKTTLEAYLDINVVGTENLIKACMEANPPEKPVHLLFMSSTAVYGSRRPKEVLTEESETKPSDPYGESKVMAEMVIKAFAEAHSNFRYTILRCATMWGPHYEGPSFKLYKAVQSGKMRYIGNSMNHQIMVHVDDVADAFLQASDSPRSINKTYIITDGQTYTQKYILDRIAEFLGVPAPKKRIGVTLAKLTTGISGLTGAELDYLISDRVVDISKAKGELGFRPARGLDREGREHVNDFLKKYKK